MSLTTRPSSGYSRLQIALHWGVALAVVFNYLVSEGMEDAFDAMIDSAPLVGEAQGFWLPGLHVWVGVAVLVLVILRLGVRRWQGAPDAEAGLAGALTTWGHRALYLAMLAVPALGCVTWFRGLEATADLHVYAANALMILAGGHAALAVYHQLVLKDGVMWRMMRPR